MNANAPADTSAPWHTVSRGIKIRVRLTPKSSRDAIGDIIATPDGSAVQAWVRAVPEDGRANSAICRLTADWLGIPKSNVSLAQGTKSRIKTLLVTGDSRQLADQLASKLTPAS